MLLILVDSDFCCSLYNFFLVIMRQSTVDRIRNRIVLTKNQQQLLMMWEKRLYINFRLDIKFEKDRMKPILNVTQQNKWRLPQPEFGIDVLLNSLYTIKHNKGHWLPQSLEIINIFSRVRILPHNHLVS